MPVLIDIDYTVTDADNDQVDQTAEYSTDGISYSPMTMATGDGLHVYSPTLSSGTTAAGVNQHIVHDAEADLGIAYIGPVYYRLTLDDGTVQPQFTTNIAVNLNEEPFVTAVSGAQRPNGWVDVTYRVHDPESQACDLTQCEWDTDPGFSSPAALTAVPGDPAHDGTTGLPSTPAGIDAVYVWDATADLTLPFNGTVYVRKNVTDSLGAVGTGSVAAISYATRGVAAGPGSAFGRVAEGSPSSRKPLAARNRRVRQRQRRIRLR